MLGFAHVCLLWWATSSSGEATPTSAHIPYIHSKLHQTARVDSLIPHLPKEPRLGLHVIERIPSSLSSGITGAPLLVHEAGEERARGGFLLLD